MKAVDWEFPQSSQSRILILSALCAFILECTLMIGIGLQPHHQHSLQPTHSLDETRFIEAEMVQIPEEAHLVEEKKPSTPAAQPEATLSRVAGKGKESQQAPTQEIKNETQAGPPPIALNHGPVVVFSPPPVIPSYLQNQDLKTHVVIDFYVKENGNSNPRLVGSSGNEELDAIALSAVKKWQFRPAEQEGKPIDSKVRLRIVFEVK